MVFLVSMNFVSFLALCVLVVVVPQVDAFSVAIMVLVSHMSNILVLPWFSIWLSVIRHRMLTKEKMDLAANVAPDEHFLRVIELPESNKLFKDCKPIIVILLTK